MASNVIAVFIMAPYRESCTFMGGRGGFEFMQISKLLKWTG